MSDSGVFKIRPAGRHILTIGRDLIQDPYAAVVELVKNAYDADASKVEIFFSKQIKKEIIDGEEVIKNGIQIWVSDNGHGMTRLVVTDKWMVPSTDDKQVRKISPKGRIMQGRKGIGRYASAILGNDLFLETVSEDTREKTSLLVNWTSFEKAKYLSDVDILIETTKTNEVSGTKLLINGDASFLQEWENGQFEQLEKELKKIMTPIEDTKASADSKFDIYLSINGFGDIDIENKRIEPFPLFDLFDYRISGEIDKDGNGTLTYILQKVRNSLPEKINFSFGYPTNCGNVSFDIRVFDRDKDAIDDLISRGLKDDRGNYVGKLEARRLLNENNGPAELRQEIFDLLFQSVEIATFTPEDKIKYDFNMTTERDIRNQIRYAEKKGMEKERLKNARKLKDLGFDSAIIAQATDLTVEQIQAL